MERRKITFSAAKEKLLYMRAKKIQYQRQRQRQEVHPRIFYYGIY